MKQKDTHDEYPTDSVPSNYVLRFVLKRFNRFKFFLIFFILIILLHKPQPNYDLLTVHNKDRQTALIHYIGSILPQSHSHFFP